VYAALGWVGLGSLCWMTYHLAQIHPAWEKGRRRRRRRRRSNNECM